MKPSYIDPDRVRHLFDYDASSGDLFWKNPQSRRVEPGDVAGNLKSAKGSYPYWVVRMDGLKYRRARLVWAYVYGENPPMEIDHKDRDKTNDRVENLRAATRSQNGVHRIVSKTTCPHLPRGVKTKRKSGRKVGYVGRVTIDGRQRYFGPFATAEKAGEAVKAAICEHWGAAWWPDQRAVPPGE